MAVIRECAVFGNEIPRYRKVRAWNKRKRLQEFCMNIKTCDVRTAACVEPRKTFDLAERRSSRGTWQMYSMRDEGTASLSRSSFQNVS